MLARVSNHLAHQHLERQLQAAADARFRLIATDGVFSMDGYLAKLPEICALARKYQAVVMVDDGETVEKHASLMEMLRRLDDPEGLASNLIRAASGRVSRPPPKRELCRADARFLGTSRASLSAGAR